MKNGHLFDNNNLFFLFLLSLVICLSFIFSYPIYILDEAKNAEAAREMLINGNWIVPYFNDVLRTDKPPLHYFFMMMGYEIFGVNAFGARFFSSVFGALTLVGTFYYVRKLKDVEWAKWTWIVLASSLFFIQVFHQAVPDPYLIFFVSMGLFSFFDYYLNRKFWALLLFYIFLGLGVLSKGPVALVLPVLVVVIFLLVKREVFTLKFFQYRPVLGLLIFLTVAAPWYLAVHYVTDGAWTEGFLLDHNINRFNTKKEGHGGPFVITWLFVILGLLPFSVFLIQGLIRGWKTKADNFILFCFITAVVFIVFFSISGTKLPNYTMPSYPLMAVLIAYYLKDFVAKKQRQKSVKTGLLALIVLSILLPIAGYIGLTLEKQLISIRWVSFCILIITVGAFLAYRHYLQLQFEKCLYTISVSWMLLAFAMFGVVYPVLTAQNPVSLAKEKIPMNATLISYKRFDSAFPINFNRTIDVIYSIDSIAKYLEAHPEAFVLSNDRTRNDLLTLNGIEVVVDQKALFENHHTLIIKKK